MLGGYSARCICERRTQSDAIAGSYLLAETSEFWWWVRVLPPPGTLIWRSPGFIRPCRTAGATHRFAGSYYRVEVHGSKIHFLWEGFKFRNHRMVIHNFTISLCVCALPELCRRVICIHRRLSRLLQCIFLRRMSHTRSSTPVSEGTIGRSPLANLPVPVLP